MDNIADRTHPLDRDRRSVGQGGDKPGPYPRRFLFVFTFASSRVGTGLVPDPVMPAIYRFLYLLLASFLLCSSMALLLISSSQQALALGNTFIITMLGSSQQPGFAPDLLTMHIYDTVVFVNAATVPIAITATDNSFSSPAIAPGKQWKVTFNSAGAFEYHDTGKSTPRIFGEIVVVPNTVALLPAPAPAAQETAIAYIQASKTPPDTVWQQTTSSAQTPVTVSSTQKQTTRTLSVPPLSLLLPFVRPVILVVIVLFPLLAAGLGGLWLYRRRQSHKREDDDEDDEDDSDE